MRAKVQGPIMEVLERREYAVLYRERTVGGVKLVLKHYLSDCDYFADIVYIGDDGYLDVYHVRTLDREDYLRVFLDSETAEQIRKEVMSVKTFEDFYKLLDSLLRATFCNSEKQPRLYRICK
jgi:hypothetical protein